MNPLPVVVFGTVALDRFVRVDASGEALSPPVELPGGEALNTARVLHDWGVPVALVGTCLGDDPEGDRLRALMDQAGLSRLWVPDRPGAVTPYCEIQVFPDGERCMSGKGFAQAVAPPVPEVLFAARPVVAVDPNLGEAARETARRARAAGCPVVAMDFAHDPEIVACATVLQVSMEALRRWGGPTGSPEEVALALHQQGAPAAIVTLGPDGGVVASAGGVWRYAAVRVPRAVDTTGAGDTFRAGLCYGLAHGWPLDKTITLAAKAAAQSCLALGGGVSVAPVGS